MNKYRAIYGIFHLKIDKYQAIINNINKKSDQFLALVSTLDALSPLKVMQRGYAIFRTDSHLVRSVEDADVGNEAVVQVRDGKFGVIIKHKEKDNQWKI